MLPVTMPPKYILMVQEGCPGCKVAAKKAEDDPDIEVVDIGHNKQYRKIAEKLNILTVPTILRIDRGENKICTPTSDSEERCIIYERGG